MTSPVPRLQLFISDSHADREWVDRLQTVLKPVERSDGLDLWGDSRIEPGARLPTFFPVKAGAADGAAEDPATYGLVRALPPKLNDEISVARAPLGEQHYP